LQVVHPVVHIPKMEGEEEEGTDSPAEQPGGEDAAETEDITVEMIGEADDLDEISQVSPGECSPHQIEEVTVQDVKPVVIASCASD